jgi:hypothetical protein
LLFSPELDERETLAAQHIQTPEGSAEPKVDMGPLVEAGLSLCGNIEQ